MGDRPAQEDDEDDGAERADGAEPGQHEEAGRVAGLPGAVPQASSSAPNAHGAIIDPTTLKRPIILAAPIASLPWATSPTTARLGGSTAPATVRRSAR